MTQPTVKVRFRRQFPLNEGTVEDVPLYAFGSPELAALHERARNQPRQAGLRADGWRFYGDGWEAQRTYPVHIQVYGTQYAGYLYVVHHSSARGGPGFYTLNGIEADKVSVSIRDLKRGPDGAFELAVDHVQQS